MANNNHIETPKLTSPKETAHPSERLQHSVNDFLRGVGQEGPAKAIDAFTAMNQKLLSNTAVGEIFGNLSIVDKQGKAVSPWTAGSEQLASKSVARPEDPRSKSGGENKEPHSAAVATALRFGQLDGDATEHVGNPTQLAAKTAEKVKVPDHVIAENTLMTARTSASQTERTRSAAQIEKKRSTEKAKGKREQSKIKKDASEKTSTKAEQNKGNRESSSTRDSKLEQKAHRAQQQSHKTEPKSHAPERKARTPEQHNHEGATKHPDHLTQHDHGTKAKHEESPPKHAHDVATKHPEPSTQNHHKADVKHAEPAAQDKREAAGKHPEQAARNNRDAASKHPEPTPQNNHEVVKHQEPRAQHDRQMTAHKTELSKETITAHHLDRPTPAQHSDKITALQRLEKPATSDQPKEKLAAKTPPSTRTKESRAALYTSTPPPIKTPESATARQINAEIALKQAPPLTPKQETTKKVIKQSQLIAAGTEKGADKSVETVSANRSQSISKSLPEETTQLRKQEQENEKDLADRSSTKVAQAQHKNNTADWADLNHNNAEFLTRQDHASAASSNDRGTIVHSHTIPDSSHNALARSTHPISHRIESSSKVHSINHIVSSLGGHSGTIDSGRVTPDPEVLNKNKSTTGGTSTSSTAGTTTLGPAHTGPYRSGHSGQNHGTVHGTGTNGNSGNNSQPGSSSTKTPDPASPSKPTDPGKSPSSPTGNTVTPTNPGTPTSNPTAGNNYGGPIIIEPPSSNGDRQALFLLELFAEIGFWAALDAHNTGRKLAINPHSSDITNPAIPGNMFNPQSYVNQPGNPSSGQPIELIASQPILSDASNPNISSVGSAQNSPGENNLGLNLNRVVSEPSAPTGGGNGLVGRVPAGASGGSDAQPPSAPSGVGFEGKGSPAVNPALSDPGTGPLETSPPNGSPYLSGSVDYWGGDPAANSNNPGTGPNSTAPLPDQGYNNDSASSRQPNYTGHLQPEQAQSDYAPLRGEINNLSDGHNQDKERTLPRPEISDPWSVHAEHTWHTGKHHLHEQEKTAHDNQLEHKLGQHRHDLLANDPWQEQNHGRKFGHIQSGSETQKNGRLPAVKDDNLISQLIGLLIADKNGKEPKQQAQTYVVKEGDTLENIAISILSDARLGQLIYIINKAILLAQTDWRQCQLREGLVLFLPVEAEIRCFRVAMIEKEKQNKALMNLPGNDQINDENLDLETRQKLATRRSNVERLLGSISEIFSQTVKSASGQEQVTVRLGDTLRSIALKHSSLHDVSLWKLLAQLNELSCAVDAKGVPTAVLTRGMVLQLPTNDEIAEYRANQAKSTRALSPRKALMDEILNEPLSIG